MKNILETQRLILREFNLNDAGFIVTLLNTPAWLEFIGDKKVKTIEDAEKYLREGPLESYRKNGFGLSLVLLKDGMTPIGMCGLIKRETLDDIDIGFAFLPEYERQGYGYEIAKATLDYARNSLKIEKVVAITSPNNIASIRLLNKLGLQFERTIALTEKDKVLLFFPVNSEEDKRAIDEVTRRFFSLFTNLGGAKPDVKGLSQIFIPEGILISNTSALSKVETVNAFVESREKMLIKGNLTDFSEREISGRTEVFGNIAQRFCLYEKSGVLNGVNFETKGMKTLQFLKVSGEWKMSSAAWHDV